MTRLLGRLVPGVLLVIGVVAMAVSSLVGGGVSAIIGLPLFVIGFVWLLFPRCRRHRPE